MAYLLFVDESGQDHRIAPYEVLAGAAIHDTHLWSLVRDIQALEESIFGTRVTSGPRELKARELLKRKTYRLAAQGDPIARGRRASLCRQLIVDGVVSREHLTAIGQSKVEFARELLRMCAAHGVSLFASIVEPDAEKPLGSLLRKDYAYLFERFYYFLESQPANERGLVVFDELDRSRAHILVDQMAEYFQRSRNGQMRVSRIIPEPLFVHSDLTTGVQIADLAAYLTSWNVRFGSLNRPRRMELDDLGQAVLALRYRATIERDGYPEGFGVWSFSHIDDLRPRGEKGLDRLGD